VPLPRRDSADHEPDHQHQHTEPRPGIALLGDTVPVSVVGLAAVSASLAGMIFGVILIDRS
jgi:hypothetical protein